MVLGVRSKKKLKKDSNGIQRKQESLEKQVVGRSNLRILKRLEDRRIKTQIVNRKGALFFNKPEEFKTFFKNGRQQFNDEFSRETREALE